MPSTGLFLAQASTAASASFLVKARGFSQIGKFLSCWIGLRGANDLDVVRRLLQHGGHLPAPPAEANHRDFDGSGFIHFKISTCEGLDLQADGGSAFHALSPLPYAVLLLLRKLA
jgi:hypothetical protein